MKNPRLRNRKARNTETKSEFISHYLILTDTEETEKNYMYGLRDTIPNELKRKIIIKVERISSRKIIEDSVSLAARQNNLSEPWIIFDRDKVKDFDRIIEEAENKGINVAWSNPCIEIWFFAYFGSMPNFYDSVDCVKGFEREFKKITGKKYHKGDEQIYSKLIKYGNEKEAVAIARQTAKHQLNSKPSKQCPGTVMYLLIEKIKKQIENT